MILKQEKWLLILLIFCCSLGVTAQKKKVTTDSEATPPPLPKPRKTTAQETPKQVNFTIVEVDANSKIKIYSISEQAEYTSQSNSADLSKAATITLNQKIPLKLLGSGEIIIKPDSSLKYEEVVKVAKILRSQTKQKIQVKLADYFYALTSPAKTNTPPRPNPLFLIVNIDRNGKILLNYEDDGTTKDFSKLQNHLVSIFKDREDNGVFREGSNEVEKAIFIKVLLSLAFSEVTKIAEVIKETGANPIVLQIDDLQP